MKNITSLLLLFFFWNISFAENVKLIGSIGKYKIEMELSSTGGAEKYNLSGKYNYKGKTASLNIDGNIFGKNILELNEYYKEENTGTFYLEKFNDSLKGKWIAGKKYYDVWLKIESGDWNQLIATNIDDLNLKTNNNTKGSYIEEHYFLNDMWFTEENPQIEIGFNGGYVMIEEVHKDSILFHLNKTCGPTYHMAYAFGLAHRINDSTFLYQNKDEYSDEMCSFTISINRQEVKIEQSSPSFVCGFGARAYADGTFIKVKNKIVKQGGEMPYIKDIYKLEE